MYFRLCINLVKNVQSGRLIVVLCVGVGTLEALKLEALRIDQRNGAQTGAKIGQQIGASHDELCFSAHIRAHFSRLISLLAQPVQCPLYFF